MSVLHNIAAALPEFTDDPVDRLAHTLAAYADSSGGDWAIRATSNAVPEYPVTGLTWDDLRAILAQLRPSGVDEGKS